MGRCNTKYFQGITLVRDQRPAPFPRPCHAATITAGDRHRTGGSWAAPAPLPRGEDALRDSGVSAREGCASSNSKKRTSFLLSIFFPSGLNPLLERDNYLQGNRHSALSGTQPAPPLLLQRGHSAARLKHAGTMGCQACKAAPHQEHCEHRMLQADMGWSLHWSQGYHRAFPHLPSPGELTQE